ncbi:hypothetical protein DFH08DRAFT_813041 [Mycena albidolilacea]|uniref:Uncharacterized protein n=1 Tax=Mycena albidolilacea TaxID=1033008 RepID=A0AAD6ZTH4_9AGAR|nr:hypothetical protein DFH08DRAFT_813041 [Mycena albidolilacea]
MNGMFYRQLPRASENQEGSQGQKIRNHYRLQPVALQPDHSRGECHVLSSILLLVSLLVELGPALSVLDPHPPFRWRRRARGRTGNVKRRRGWMRGEPGRERRWRRQGRGRRHQRVRRRRGGARGTAAASAVAAGLVGGHGIQRTPDRRRARQSQNGHAREYCRWRCGRGRNTRGSEERGCGGGRAVAREVTWRQRGGAYARRRVGEMDAKRDGQGNGMRMRAWEKAGCAWQREAREAAQQRREGEAGARRQRCGDVAGGGDDGEARRHGRDGRGMEHD